MVVELDPETHQEEEDPEREDVCPEDRKMYPSESKSWQGSLPEDSCEYKFLNFSNIIFVTELHVSHFTAGIPF